ncbi:lipoate--protein ligase [Geomonas sp. Red276]
MEMKTTAPLWRLVDTGPLEGAANMAVDEALLTCFRAGASLPVLRLYGWAPPTLSLGRYQEAAASLDLGLCRAEGVPVVRRMTGGGVIYHADELTYSIVCSPADAGEGGVKAGFRRLCSFLIEGYRRLGLDPGFAVDHAPQGERLGERTSFCFAGKEEYDVLVGGRKVGGNAQRRLREAILQHGSIPLINRVADGVRFLAGPAPGAESAVSLAELGIVPGAGRLKEILVESFEAVMGARLVPGPLTEAERELASRLEREKYRGVPWTLQGAKEGERCPKTT